VRGACGGFLQVASAAGTSSGAGPAKAKKSKKAGDGEEVWQSPSCCAPGIFVAFIAFVS
jgi:hypothetical protein